MTMGESGQSSETPRSGWSRQGGERSPANSVGTVGARTAPSDSDHGIPASVVTWALRRFWWLIIAAGLALGLGAYTVLNTFNPGYQSQARVLVGQLAGSTDSLRASASLGQTYADALISETLLRRVFSAAGVQSPSETAILSAADVQFTVNSRILTIQMTWSDPETARKLSDLMVKEMLKPPPSRIRRQTCNPKNSPAKPAGRSP